ncbi:MAG: hypothetical protein HC853_07730 [Anaerolineae bacterium]|nr:hypothetical protein [Anaerolineae bacterium]
MSRLALVDRTAAQVSSLKSTAPPPTPSLRIHLLGTPEPLWHGQPLALARRQTRALLYRLAASAQPLSRDELCFLFWPDIGESAARRQLTVLLNHLRRDLPTPDVLISAEDAINLNPAFVEVDVWQFEQTANEALRNPSITALSIAAECYRGPFLHGFALPNSAEFETWAAQQRQAYEQRYLDVLAEKVRGIITSLLSIETSWPLIVQALADAQSGGYARLFQLIPAIGTVPLSNTAFFAIKCNDAGTRRSAAEYLSMSYAVGELTPRLHDRFFVANIVSTCAAWPSANPPIIRNISRRLATPILLLGNDFDPNTPLSWTRQLASALGMERNIVRYRGGGHTMLRAAQRASAGWYLGIC